MRRIAVGKPNGGKRVPAVSVLCAMTALALPAQTFTSLLSFDGTDGYGPYDAVVQARNGNFYGTTEGGGANRQGTVFQITPGGTHGLRRRAHLQCPVRGSLRVPAEEHAACRSAAQPR